jgi:hypothetical protein
MEKKSIYLTQKAITSKTGWRIYFI